MAKRVELIITINEHGEIFVSPEGTSGNECLDLMSFFEKIDEFEVLETKLISSNESKKIKIKLKNQNKNS